MFAEHYQYGLQEHRPVGFLAASETLCTESFALIIPSPRYPVTAYFFPLNPVAQGYVCCVCIINQRIRTRPQFSRRISIGGRYDPGSARRDLRQSSETVPFFDRSAFEGKGPDYHWTRNNDLHSGSSVRLFGRVALSPVSLRRKRIRILPQVP